MEKIEDFISNTVNQIIENENRTYYGAMALIMKKCNIKELIFTPEELANIEQNKLITIKDIKTKNLIVKVVK